MRKLISLLLAAAMVLSMGTVAFAAEATFTDLEEGQYYVPAVEWAVAEGITTGMSATEFAPHATCTRGQVVTFLYRAAGEPEVAEGTENPFTDVAKDAYYYNAVLWAVANEITTGMTETTFGPDGECKREHVVTFQYRAAGKPEGAAKAAFTDVAEDAYYAPAVAWAVENGITTGATETTFNPEGACERAHVVTFLYRAEQNAAVEEPEITEPAETKPAATEPAATEPAATEPAATEPAETEPAATEPAETEPAETEPAGTEENPIVIAEAADMGAVAVAAGEEVYYTINKDLLGQGLELTIEAKENVVVTVNGEEVILTEEAESYVIALEGTEDMSVVVSNTGEEAAELVAYILAALGTESNPIIVDPSNIQDAFLVPAGETVYYQGRLAGLTMSYYDMYGTKVVFDGKEYVAGASGNVMVSFPESDMFPAPMYVFSVTSTGDGDAYWYPDFIAPGSFMMPEALESIDTIVVSLEEGDEDGYYYSWTAEKDGTLTITAVDYVADTYDVDLSADSSYSYPYMSDNDETVAEGTVSIDVVAGDVVKIHVGGMGSWDEGWTTYTIPAVNVTLNGTFTEKTGTQENPIVIAESSDMGAISADAGESVYYTISKDLLGQGLLLNIEAKENVTVTVNGEAAVANEDGYYVIDLAEAEADMAVVIANSGEEAIEAVAYIQAAPGTEGNPIMIVPQEMVMPGGSINAFSFSVPAAETVYYQGRLSGQILTIQNAYALKVTVGEDEYYAAMMGENAGKIIIEFPAYEGIGMAPATALSITNMDEENEFSDMMVFTEPEVEVELKWGYAEANVASVEQFGTCEYSWTAETAGTVTVTIDTNLCEDWYFMVDVEVNGYPSGAGEMHYSDDETVVNEDSVTVAAGDTVIIVVGTASFAAGEVPFYLNFTEAAAE